MTLKLNFPGLAPAIYQALASVNSALDASSLGKSLIDLVFYGFRKSMAALFA